MYISGEVGEKGEKGLVGTPGPRVIKYFLSKINLIIFLNGIFKHLKYKIK